MSGRLVSREASPSPPKSRSPKRRPLHQRSDSEINERNLQRRVQSSVRQLAGGGQENSSPAAKPLYDLPKIYTTSPFPTFESQILRPFPEPAAQRGAHAGSVAADDTSRNPTHDRHATTTTPVIIDNGSLRSHDFSFHNDSIRSSGPSFSVPDSSFSEAGLTTPASTIRLVNDTPSPRSSRHVAMTNFSLPSSARIRRSYYDENYSPSISDLPTLPREASAEPALDTPTPAARQYRPTIRAIADIQSEATQTPGSARSVNSSGTQVHRPSRAAGDVLPRGSYLHYADKRVRRSNSDPELTSSSPEGQRLYGSPSLSPSPNVRRLAYSPTSSPNVRLLNESPLSPPRPGRQASNQRVSRNFSSPASEDSDRRDRFPALTRYVQATRSSRSPTPARDSQASRADILRSPRRRLRPAHQRWSSVESFSDFRSMSPSDYGSEMGALLEEPSTIESALSISIASAHPSIRLVEPAGSSPMRSDFAASTSQVTPRTTNRQWREDTEVPEPTTDSPAWVSYSSPITHLPHVAESTESLPTPERSRRNPTRLSEHSYTSEVNITPVSPNVQDVIYPSNSSHDVRMPHMRRRSTLRQTTPFFTPGSNRGHLRQSTIGTSPNIAHSDLDFGFNSPEPSIGATSAFQPSPDPRGMSPTIGSNHSTPNMNAGAAQFEAPEPPMRSPRRPRVPFPAGASSIGNTPNSIHIPRNRANQTLDNIQPGHTRNQTYGGNNSSRSSQTSSRRTSSPTLPSLDYGDEPESPLPFTPPTRPGNPTPGVTPATTHVRSPDRRSDRFETIPISSPVPEVPPLRPSRPQGLSFLLPADQDDEAADPSRNRMHVVTLKNQQQRRAARDSFVNNDWTPHLWHGAPHALNRRSAFIAPSIDSTSTPFLHGTKARRDVQVLLFVLGFILPPCWLLASMLPLPQFGKVDGLGALGGGRSERLAKGKSIIGADDLEKEIQWTADEVASYESARWWRRLNRFLSPIGLAVSLVLIIIGVVTVRGGIQTA